MTTAFVLDNETILCRYTAKGWWPLQVSLSAIENNIVEQGVAEEDLSDDMYQVGRVKLLASLAASHWKPDESQAFATNQEPTNNDDVPVNNAITYHYAQTHGIATPELTKNSHELATLLSSSEHTENVDFITYRQLITQLPAALSTQLSQAIQLLRWQADTQFCSRCSASVTTAKFGERAMVCPVCRLRQYPRVQPCVITAITRPNPQTGEMQILLAHHHRYGQPSTQLLYGLIAGFVEVGESLEHAVVREVEEEVGIRLTDIRYVSSQPWPFPSNLMLGFRASYASGEIVIQEDELSHADFFDISNLPKIPFKGSIAYDLIAQIAHEQGIIL
ncbi:NAD(+) diphosphatase [Psychrobacter sp. S1-30-MNA-CIBAN-0213]|uniref:NAD(+) diphosphatase n=2 Tax=Psychrobacter TaxID=497 RepID=UPI00332AF498